MKPIIKVKTEVEEGLPFCSLQRGASLLQQSELKDEMGGSPAGRGQQHLPERLGRRRCVVSSLVRVPQG